MPIFAFISIDKKVKDNLITSSRLVQLDLEGNVIAVWDSPRHAANELNLDPSHIRKCVKGTRQTHKGFKWKLENFDCDSEPTALEITVDPEEPMILSAYLDGKIMNIDQYCEFYGLPRKSINSYKLITHTGTPYYNIHFKESVVVDSESIDFDSIIQKHLSSVQTSEVIKSDSSSVYGFTRLIYTDVHIVMYLLN